VPPNNPYVAGNPVGGSEAFIGRADVLREVVRVLRRPQDNAVVLYGQRRIGKTLLLEYLNAPEMRQTLYGPRGERLLFSFLDC
jgi:predicted AAA+ superfamily ATPase